MKKQSRTQNSIRNLITGIGSHTLVIVLQFVTRTVFIATLGKEYLGINGLFSDILKMLSLTELGIDTAIHFRLYQPLAAGDTQRVRLLLKFYRSAYRVIGTVILVLGMCLIPALPYLIKDYSSLADLGIDASLVFVLFLTRNATSYLFFASRSAIIKADQKKYILDFVELGIGLLSCVCEILILILWKNFVAYTVSALAFTILQNLINAWIATHSYPNVFTKTSDRISRTEIKDMFKDLGALFVYKVNTVVIKTTDNIVLSTFIGLSMVGLYSNYLLFYTTAISLLDRIYGAVKASAGNLYAVADVEKKYQFFEIMNFITMLFYGTACVGVAVVGNELIACWIGDNYVIPQPLAILVGIEILFKGFKNNFGQTRTVSGVFRQMWFRPILGIIINVVLSIVMVQFIGIYGVLIGTVAADIFANFMIDPKLIHKYSFQNFKKVSVYYIKNMKYMILLLAVGFADICLCSVVLHGYGWGTVIAHTIICGLSVPLVFFSVYKRTYEAQYLLGMLKRCLKR